MRERLQSYSRQISIPTHLNHKRILKSVKLAMEDINITLLQILAAVILGSVLFVAIILIAKFFVKCCDRECCGGESDQTQRNSNHRRGRISDVNHYSNHDSNNSFGLAGVPGFNLFGIGANNSGCVSSDITYFSGGGNNACDIGGGGGFGDGGFSCGGGGGGGFDGGGSGACGCD